MKRLRYSYFSSLHQNKEKYTVHHKTLLIDHRTVIRTIPEKEVGRKVKNWTSKISQSQTKEKYKVHHKILPFDHRIRHEQAQIQLFS